MTLRNLKNLWKNIGKRNNIKGPNERKIMSAKTTLKRIKEKCERAKKRIDNYPNKNDGIRHPSEVYNLNIRGEIKGKWARNI